MSQKGVFAIKPLSRFVEHFDMMPPTELLDMIGVEEQQQQQQEQEQQQKNKDKNKNYNKPTPLYALPGFSKRNSSNSMNSPEQTSMSSLPYGATSPISPTSPKRRSYLVDRNASPTVLDSPIPSTPPILSHRSNSSFSSSSYNETVLKNNNNKSTTTKDPEAEINKSVENANEITATDILNNIVVASNSSKLSNISKHPQKKQQQQQDQIFAPLPTGNTKDKLGGRVSLNRAEIIIKRYESWNKFIVLLCNWMNDIAKHSIKSDKSSYSIFRDNKPTKPKNDDTANGLHGSTADLALQGQKFGRHLQNEHIPILVKFKKECISHIKNLKSRPELNLEEFFKRAEVTASLISQLTKTCKEARRTIEKNGQVNSDPWLINLYVLRQLRGEVSEENRLRNLMVPIQKTMQDFEVRLLKSVEEGLKVCFDQPGALTDAQLSTIQSSLNQAISNNWTTFAAMNKKDIVDENNPLKHYLNINYTCKNDPLVMTVHKGQLERRSGVLNNKYTQRFCVITKSGFLHQFKLNDQVSPDHSMYLPKSTIVPCISIDSTEDLLQEERKAPKDGFTFEIQRPGSVLQRDKSYVFRAINFDDMATWCRLFSEIATQPPEFMLQNIFQSTQLQNATTSSKNSLPLSIDVSHPQQQLQNIQKQTKITAQPQQPESTPPPSPIQKLEKRKSILSILSTIEVSKNPQDPVISSTHLLEFPNGKPKLYTPQLQYSFE